MTIDGLIFEKEQNGSTRLKTQINPINKEFNAENGDLNNLKFKNDVGYNHDSKNKNTN